MKNILYVLIVILAMSANINCSNDLKSKESNTVIAIVNDSNEVDEEEHEGYDGAALREEFEFDRIKDPVTGKVPAEKLWEAIKYTNSAKSSISFRTQAFAWQERGPIYDSIGPSNGNGRGANNAGAPGTYTSGRIRGVIVDASDATGNTVWCGGVAGGVWRCTNFLSTEPNWVSINDNFLNMSVSSICQDPTNSNILYFSTGEPTNNSDAVLGMGIWKSVDHGNTWSQLNSSSSFTQIFKVGCDASGNVYFAARGNGLRRSTDGGNSFTAITPTGALASCTDFEFSSTGRLHASFGYNTGSASAAASYRYTDNPTTVINSTWSSSTGLPTAVATANRIELTTSGSVVYAITTNGSNNIYATWRSSDGGATFARMNVSNYTTDVTNTQGWYDITLAVDPADPLHIVIGGLNMYSSADGGVSIVKMSYWVDVAPYVHADQHNTIWYTSGAESRMIVACDGGLFYSNDGGFTWNDRNKNLAIKQFYSCALRPESGSAYIIGGTQDNGVHQLTMPGKTYSKEVTGGDGAFVDISQTDPSLQFGSYIFNVYRRSVNSGANWSTVTFSTTAGLFINPFDYDELSDALYACYGTNTLLRWNTPASGNSNNTFTVSGLGTPSAVTASPYTSGTAYVGSTTGSVYKIPDANTAVGTSASATYIGDFSMTGYVSCINTGTTDNTLVVVMSSYNVNNVWYSTNGGTTWSQIDGNLPNMPVRWAVFPPGVNDRLVIATEAGVYTSGIINGSTTVWTPSLGFPTVRTDMVKIRANDNTLVAATHGRGLWSANLLQVLPVRGLILKGSINSGGQSVLNWTSSGAVPSTRFHVQYSKDGISFSDVGETTFSENKYHHTMLGTFGFYRIVADEPGIAPVISNVVMFRNNNVKGFQISIAPNPVRANATLLISGVENGNYRWEVITIAGQIMQRGNGPAQQNTTYSVPMNIAQLTPGTYWLRFIQGKNTATIPFIKQ